MNKKEIRGYEKKYLVSKDGRVWKKNGVEVGQWMSEQGYMLVRLSSPRKTMRVHRLVAEEFVPNPNNFPFVNHIDCIRHNNNSNNLEWCTQLQNLKHSEILGRMQRNYWKGRRSPNAIFSDESIKNIREEYEKKEISWEALGKKYGCSKRTIGRIVRNESYAPTHRIPLPQPPKEGE